MGDSVSEILAILGKLLPILLNAVTHVQGASGQSLMAAVDEVADHLTPGEPNSPHLT